MSTLAQQPNTPEQNIARYGPGCLDGIGEYSSIYQDERIATGRVTLGRLLFALDVLDPKMPVRTDRGEALHNPHSNRGYYVDLAFEPRDARQTVADLRAIASVCLNATYPGWKAGTFRMNDNTPIWVARRSETGRYVSALSLNHEGLVLVTASESDEDD